MVTLTNIRMDSVVDSKIPAEAVVHLHKDTNITQLKELLSPTRYTVSRAQGFVCGHGVLLTRNIGSVTGQLPLTVSRVCLWLFVYCIN